MDCKGKYDQNWVQVRMEMHVSITFKSFFQLCDEAGQC